jgi:uncharacterized Zn-finger protein
MMIHTGEKPHECEYPGCGKKFSEKGNMKTHMKTHCKQQKNEFNVRSLIHPKPKEIIHCEQYTYLGKKTYNEEDTTMPSSTKLEMTQTARLDDGSSVISKNKVSSENMCSVVEEINNDRRDSFSLLATYPQLSSSNIYFNKRF